MRGIYKGVECRTGEVRLDGKMEKALIYVDRPGENDEQALTAARIPTNSQNKTGSPHWRPLIYACSVICSNSSSPVWFV